MIHKPRERLRGLMVLADDDPRWPHDAVAQAEAACRGGAAVVQLRCKHSTDSEILAAGARIRAATRDAGALFFVNDRFDLALVLGADGVHLGQDDLPPACLPSEARAQLWIGRSTHTPAQIAAARLEDVDYVALGPVFGTHSKASPWPAPGLDQVRCAVAEVAPLPLIAIGGIRVAEAPALAAAGVGGIAVISAVAAARDPEAATRALVAAFARSGDGP
jgi:thiamine-phosphate pyrophosphorylase